MTMSCRLSLGKTTGCRLTAGLVQEISRYKQAGNRGEAALADIVQVGRQSFRRSSISTYSKRDRMRPWRGKVGEFNKTPRPRRNRRTPAHSRREAQAGARTAAGG